MMMCAVNRAFQLRPEPLNGVRMDAPANVFLAAMIHDLMGVAERLHEVVNVRLIRVDFGPRFNRLADVAHDAGGVHRAHDLGLNTATAIDHADHGSLASGPTAPLAGANTADIGFIRLALAKELAGLVLHELADFVSHAPRRLIGHAKLPFQFLGRYAVPGGGHQEDGKEPRHEAGGGLVEDGACRGVNLIAAPSAGIGAAVIDGMEAVRLAALVTFAASRPARVEQEIKAGAVIGKLGLEIF